MIKQKSKQKRKTSMSKTRRRTHSESESYKGVIRELQKENRQLKKELRQYIKREDLYENNKDEIHEVIEKQKKTEESSKRIKCQSCGKGYLDVVEIMNRVFGTCVICGDRKKLK